jgi:hypothetical protein
MVVSLKDTDQMLPIAIAVVEGETKDSWKWFLDLLINDLGGKRLCDTYTFISDQQKVMFTLFTTLHNVLYDGCIFVYFVNFT